MSPATCSSTDCFCISKFISHYDDLRDGLEGESLASPLTDHCDRDSHAPW